MKTALVLIDIQNDYFPGGKMELVGSLEASSQARQVLEAFRAQGWPIFHVQHLAIKPNATFFIPDTPGAEIHQQVQPLPGEVVVQKHFPNSFRETDLLARLKAEGVTRLVLAGMMTHMCVDATVRGACDHGFECVLIHDACATRNLAFDGKTAAAGDVQTAFVAALNGSYAKVMTAAEFVEQLG